MPQKLQMPLLVDTNGDGFLAGRVRFKAVLRPNGPLFKTAAAIGAGVVQDIVDTLLAKGAFKGTDHGVCRIGGQIPAAGFTLWFQLKHVSDLNWK